MKGMKGIAVITLICYTFSYLDASLEVIVSGPNIAINLPTKIGSKEYKLQLSFSNKPEGIKYKKQTKNKIANFKATSVQGHTLEGWRRFFQEVILFAKKIYSHQPSVDVSGLNSFNHAPPLSDGLITFGPRLNNNQFFIKLRQNAEGQIEGNVVSFYMGVNMKIMKMQIGNYEMQHAKGDPRGISFFKIPLEVSGINWVAPIKKIFCSRQRNNKWESIGLPGTDHLFILSIESQFIILPQNMKEDIERNFENQSVDCDMGDQLTCKGMNSIDESLTFLSLQIADEIFLNISLYDLRETYNEKTKVSTYFLKVGNELQIGTVIMKNYYISLDLDRKILFYSPLNRFPNQIVTTVGVTRFLIYAAVFMFSACIIVAIWIRMTINPKRRRPVNVVNNRTYLPAQDQED